LLVQAPQVKATTPEGLEEARYQITSASFAKHRPANFNKQWSVDDTKDFYNGLRQCGTDFTLMSRLLKTRSKPQIKRKYLLELKDNPDLVRAALNPTVSIPLDVEKIQLEVEDEAEVIEAAIDKAQEPLSSKAESQGTTSVGAASGGSANKVTGISSSSSKKGAPSSSSNVGSTKQKVSAKPAASFKSKKNSETGPMGVDTRVDAAAAAGVSKTTAPPMRRPAPPMPKMPRMVLPPKIQPKYTTAAEDGNEE